MRSLFAKILVWFMATVVVTFLVAAVVVNLGLGDRGVALGSFIGMQAFVARSSWERNGAAGLKLAIDRLREATHFEGVLTDAQGRDLLTGRDYSEEIRRGRAPFLMMRSRRPVIARRAPDGKYWWVVVMPRNPYAAFFASPQGLFGLAVIVLLCYGFALHLTAPLRELEKTLVRFGQGDFRARANSTRKDELGHLSRSFDEMAGRIETLMTAERRLLLDISHELRSPLARLNVAVELGRSGGDRQAVLNRIQKEADRLNLLVGELLQVTRAEGDPRLLHSEIVNLNELLRDVVEDCAVEARARNCDVALEGAEEIAFEADPELLRRAAENVIRNAVRYSPKSQAVEVTLHNGNGAAVIEVRDRGPGVPEDALDRIFEPFYRVESGRDRATGGVGLGLSIARRAIELHKGRVSAKNLYPGLLVRMELPVIK